MLEAFNIDGLHYYGDCHLDFSGTYFNMTTFKDGYVDCCSIFECQEHDDCFIAEKLTCPWKVYKKSEVQSALKTCDYQADEKLEHRQQRFIESLVLYGYTDPMNCYPYHNVEHFKETEADKLQQFIEGIL